LVICTLDEAEAIGAVLRETRAALEGVPHEVIVVDDSVADDTARVVRAFQSVHPNIRLVRRREERGLASAVIAGWKLASGEVLGVMDGDGQHDPLMLPKLLAQMHAQDADLAVGSRYIAGASGLTGFRARLSEMGTVLTSLILGVRLADPLSGLFLVRRSWFEAVGPRLSGVGFKILVDTVASGRRRPRVAQLPTALRARRGGESKLDARVVADLAALLIEKRTGGWIQARFVLFSCVGLSGVAVNLGILALAERLGAASFAWSAAGAILVAMVWNFLLNNLLTFRDRRLRGRAFWRGLGLFCLACSGGAMVGEAAGLLVRALGGAWLAAGGLAAFAGAAWNYVLGAGMAWRRRAAGPSAPLRGFLHGGDGRAPDSGWR
jgi:dolichol-phosphate mannosyltransferase